MSEKEWNSRLRYILIDSKERTEMPVICDKMVCYGYIDNNEWYIVNLKTDKQIVKGISKSNEEAKRMLKKSLISLGAYFIEEVRTSKKMPIRMLTSDIICDIIKDKEE